MLKSFYRHCRIVTAITVSLLVANMATAQEPGTAELNQAYHALAQKDYDSAIDLFQQGLKKQPKNAAAHKDLAYTFLKAGENEEARDEFKAALDLGSSDETAALEFAFLAYETKEPIEARRMFDRLRQNGTPATRATAEQAFQNIDRPLAEGIARWKEALARSGKSDDISMYSAHRELAQLAELRDELPLAAEQYEICRKLKPQLNELLLPLARVWEQVNRIEDVRAALLAASRSKQSRTAELALEKLDRRYPYPYEFLRALDLDPQNVALRKELAYLYLAMHQDSDAIQQFEKILAIDSSDQQTREQLNQLRGFKARQAPAQITSPNPPTVPAVSAKAMGQKSLALGYVRDAIKYLRQAHEQNPNDAEVMLALGQAYNQAHDDPGAIPWFDRARRSEDSQIAKQAATAYRNLTGNSAPPLTMWALPMYSSRWKDLFTYGQVKHNIPLPANKLFSLYTSVRFVGDFRGQIQTAYGPGYLSEKSVIVGVGISSRSWHRITGWAEAGEALNYIPGRTNVAAAIPDYRGGVNFAKGFGRLLGSRTPGFFYETTADAIYVSRFDKDVMFYSQHRAGRTFHGWGGSSEQLLFNINYVHDIKAQYWANTLEMGPGVKLHLKWMPNNVYVSADFLRGVYTNNQGNPQRPNYNDIRVSFWYALSK